MKDVEEAIAQSVFEVSPETIQHCYSHVFEKVIPLSRAMVNI